MSVPWVVLPGLAEAPEEFALVVDELAEYDVRVLDPWQTPVMASVDQLRAATGTAVAERVGLVGHSIGGLAALRWALDHPEQVERLVLVDTTLTSEDGWRRLYPGTAGNRFVQGILRVLGRLGLPRLVGPLARRLLLRLGSINRHDLLPKATARSRYGTGFAALLFWSELTHSWSLAAALAERLKSPAGQVPEVFLLVATGGSSRPTAKSWLAGQQALADLIRGEVRVLSDSAHLVHLDRPDAIVTAVRG